MYLLNIMKLKNLIKLIVSSFLFFLSYIIINITISFADKYEGKKWNIICSNDDECEVGILKKIKLKDIEKEKKLASAYIRIGTKSEKKLNLVNEKDQTYKIGNLTTNVPVLFVDLPLNLDLRKKPLVRVGKTNIVNLDYLQCNINIGCKTMAIINNEVIDLFKKGDELIINFLIFGNEELLEIRFPLKGFTKSYKTLSKL